MKYSLKIMLLIVIYKHILSESEWFKKKLYQAKKIEKKNKRKDNRMEIMDRIYYNKVVTISLI